MKAILTLIAILAMAAGCDEGSLSDDLVDAGRDTDTWVDTGTGSECTPNGDPCDASEQCCSGWCAGRRYIPKPFDVWEDGVCRIDDYPTECRKLGEDCIYRWSGGSSVLECCAPYHCIGYGEDIHDGARCTY